MPIGGRRPVNGTERLEMGAGKFGVCTRRSKSLGQSQEKCGEYHGSFRDVGCLRGIETRIKLEAPLRGAGGLPL